MIFRNLSRFWANNIAHRCINFCILCHCSNFWWLSCYSFNWTLGEGGKKFNFVRIEKPITVFLNLNFSCVNFDNDFLLLPQWCYWLLKVFEIIIIIIKKLLIIFIKNLILLDIFHTKKMLIVAVTTATFLYLDNRPFFSLPFFKTNCNFMSI